MPEYDNTNRGALFKNKDKDAENHPDYKGNLNANGTEYWVSAWIKTSKAGEKYMSVSIVPKEEKTKERPMSQRAKSVDEDVPF